jgi:hypothetical protein
MNCIFFSNLIKIKNSTKLIKINFDIFLFLFNKIFDFNKISYFINLNENNFKQISLFIFFNNFSNIIKKINLMFLYRNFFKKSY